MQFSYTLGAVENITIEENMAGSVNKVILVGNLGKDPEIRQTQDGMKIASFTLATSDSWKDRTTGERKEKTEWHRVAIMNEHLSDVAEKFLKKGSKVYLEGQLQTRKWTDQSGQERYTTEIVIGRFKGELTLLDSRSNNSELTNDSAFLDAPSSSHNIDDDVPF